MTLVADATFAAGDVVRIYGKRGVYKIIELNLAHFEVTVWGGYRGKLSMRTFDSSLLKPAHKGDVAPTGGLPPAVRKGRR